jgi:hypothetical protein
VHRIDYQEKMTRAQNREQIFITHVKFKFGTAMRKIGFYFHHVSSAMDMDEICYWLSTLTCVHFFILFLIGTR